MGRGKRGRDSLDARLEPTLSLDERRSLILTRSVRMERVVEIGHFDHLEFQGTTLSSIFEERRWTPLLSQTGGIYWDMVRDFYAELVDNNPNSDMWEITVRGVRVTVSADTIATFLDIPRVPSAYPTSSTKLPNSTSISTVFLALTGQSEEYPHPHINQRDMTEFFRMLHLIISYNIDPRQHTTECSIERGIIMFLIATGVAIDLPTLIFRTIGREARSDSGDGLPYGLLITRLLLGAGIVPRADEERYKPISAISKGTLKRSGAHLQRTQRRRASQEDNILDVPLSQTTIPPSHSGSAHEVGKGSSQQTAIPPCMDHLLRELDARITPIQRQVDAVIARLARLEDTVSRLTSMPTRPTTIPLWMDHLLCELDTRITPIQRSVDDSIARLARLEDTVSHLAPTPTLLGGVVRRLDGIQSQIGEFHDCLG